MNLRWAFGPALIVMSRPAGTQTRENTTIVRATSSDRWTKTGIIPYGKSICQRPELSRSLRLAVLPSRPTICPFASSTSSIGREARAGNQPAIPAPAALPSSHDPGQARMNSGEPIEHMPPDRPAGAGAQDRRAPDPRTGATGARSRPGPSVRVGVVSGARSLIQQPAMSKRSKPGARRSSTSRGSASGRRRQKDTSELRRGEPAQGPRAGEPAAEPKSRDQPVHGCRRLDGRTSYCRHRPANNRSQRGHRTVVRSRAAAPERSEPVRAAGGRRSRTLDRVGCPTMGPVGATARATGCSTPIDGCHNMW